MKAAMQDGDLCARGGEPMYRWQLDLPRDDPRKIHADHVGVLVSEDETALPDALSCAHHNLSHGARHGNRARGHGAGASRGGGNVGVGHYGLPTW